MEFQSPPRTLRRNPPRKAKPTPATTNPPKSPISIPINNFPRFPLQDLQSDLQIPPISQSKSHQTTTATTTTITTTTTTTTKCSEDPMSSHTTANLNVFLRIRPLKASQIKKHGVTIDSKSRAKHCVSTAKSSICLSARDSQSVTLTMPQSLLDSKRIKTEVYDGFTHVFLPDSPQVEVYERIMHPLVMDFIGGKSRLLVAMGPTGSGKTHTMFGSSRDPGLVPLALRHLFLPDENDPLRRSYFISMFEIYSERGRGERMLDLSEDGADLCLQQSTIKGLQEVRVSSMVEAESLLARGMLKRATAVTNANNHSSRSQCIINIRRAPEISDVEVEIPSNNAVLTFADLAGAERERRTGNQGARLLESNFINNTSMVFGLCLRSLLEHQRNRKMPLQKHFQNSLLTRYLRDYLEAKKWMTLILTVSPGEDDYLDTSFLLRQASPFMKIVFTNNELPNKPCQKRQRGTSTKVNMNKRRKCNDSEAFVNNHGNNAGELVAEKEQRQETEVPVQASSSSSIPIIVKECGSAKLHAECNSELKRRDRIDVIMRGFSRAMWNLLKDYKYRLQVSENEVQGLKESLKMENIRLFEMQKELEKLKACCTCYKQISRDAPSNHVEDTGAEGCATDFSHFVGHIAANAIAKCEDNFFSVISAGSSPPLKPSQCLEGSEDIPNLRTVDHSTRQLKQIASMMATSDAVVDDASLFPCDMKRRSEHTPGQELERSLDTTLNVENLEGQNRLEANGFLSNGEVSEVGFKDGKALHASCIPEEDNCTFHSSKENTSVMEGPMEQAAAIFERGLLKTDASSVSEVYDGKTDITKNASQHFEQESFNLRVLVPKEKNASPTNSLKPKKPKRRLVPASSVLSRGIESFDMEDEVPKGGRAGQQKVLVKEEGRTHGSISLVQLLRGNHPVK